MKSNQSLQKQDEKLQNVLYNDACVIIEQAKVVGVELAKKALAKGIENVVFDRGGYIYIGRVASLADGAREGGLKF